MRNIATAMVAITMFVYALSTTLFIHSHIIDNQWVIHSHLSTLDDNQDLNHTHTAEQLTFIELFTSTLIGGFTLLVLAAAIFTLLSKVETQLCSAVVEYSYCEAGRAPPIHI